MKGSLLFALGMLCFGSNVYAQTSPDFQLRIPLHGQWLDHHRTGIAAWIILPDVMAEKNHFAAFAVAGPYWKYGRGNWVEILAGTRRNQNHFMDPAVNLRMADNTIPRVGTYLELGYFPHPERRRFYVTIDMDTQISIHGLKIRLGAESENVWHFTSKPNSYGIGPRLVIPLPFVRRPVRKAVLATVYQFQHGTTDFVRSYLVITF